MAATATAVHDLTRKPQPHSPTNFRGVVIAAAVGYFFQRLFSDILLPWGPAVKVLASNKLVYADVDYSNDSLQAKHGKLQKIFERVQDGEEALLKGAETIVFGGDGTLYALTEEANLISLTDFETSADDKSIVTAKSTLVKDLGMGRPLGGKFTPDGETLYMADSLLGLTRIRNPQDPASKVELVVSKVMDAGKMTPISYAIDVAVGPVSGKVYFTDSSDIVPDRVESSNMWDTLYACKLDLMRGRPTGRLLQYDPSTEEVTVLGRNIWFANGVAVDELESFVFVAETFGTRLLKYDLKTGDLKGLEVVVDSKDMTGYLDGADCDSSPNTMCYAVMPSKVSPLHKIWSKPPVAVSILLRTLVMSLPRTLVPKVKKYGGLLEVDPATGQFRYLQDPAGTDISMLGGVTVHEGKLYLGSLNNGFIGVYKLDYS
jgi:sugar lactone lactonase YvrE